MAWLAALLVWLLGLAAHPGHAQLYYGISDVSNTTATDVLRRVPLAGGAEQTVVAAGTSGYPATPTLLAYDPATNRIFVVNAFNNAQNIVAVNAATGAVSPFVTPAGTGSTNTQITGLIVGQAATTISSITRASANPTNATTVNYGNLRVAGDGPDGVQFLADHYGHCERGLSRYASSRLG